MAKDNNLPDFLTAVADSIRTAEGTTGAIPAQEFPDRIEKLSLEASDEQFVAIFVDWNGDVLGKFVLDEGDTLDISQIPTPSHEGMVFDHWVSGVNPSRIQNNILTMPDFDVVFGAIYNNIDGNGNEHDTYIDIEINNSDSLYFDINFGASLPSEIDWGDGTSDTEITSLMTHAYQTSGSYRISIISQTAYNFASLAFGQDSSNREKRVKAIHFSSLIEQPPSNLTATTGWFADCLGIRYFSMENGFHPATEARYWYLFGTNVPATESTVNFIFPESIGTYIPRYFWGMLRCNAIVVPYGCSGQSYQYTSIMFPYGFWYFTIPEGTTSFSMQLSTETSSIRLIKIHASLDSSPSVLYAAKFARIMRDTSMVIGRGMESIFILAGSFQGSSQQSAQWLKNIYIAEGVANIGQYAFYNAMKIKKLKMPSTLQSIGQRAFNYMRTCQYVDFRKATIVPTIGSIGFLQNWAKIVVPDALYDSWITATNWVSYAEYIVKASEFNESDYE